VTLALLAESLRLTMMQTVFIYNNIHISISVTIIAAMMVDSDAVESSMLRTDASFVSWQRQCSKLSLL
jgi:hypothetical protein